MPQTSEGGPTHVQAARKGFELRLISVDGPNCDVVGIGAVATVSDSIAFVRLLRDGRSVEDTPKPWSIASGGSHSSLGARVCSRSPIFGEPRYNGRRTNARRHSFESSGIGAPLLIMSAFQPPRPSRRRLLRTGALALGSLCVSGARTPLAAQEPQSVVLPTYVADVDGSGKPRFS